MKYTRCITITILIIGCMMGCSKQDQKQSTSAPSSENSITAEKQNNSILYGTWNIIIYSKSRGLNYSGKKRELTFNSNGSVDNVGEIVQQHNEDFIGKWSIENGTVLKISYEPSILTHKTITKVNYFYILKSLSNRIEMTDSYPNYYILEKVTGESKNDKSVSSDAEYIISAIKDTDTNNLMYAVKVVKIIDNYAKVLVESTQTDPGTAYLIKNNGKWKILCGVGTMITDDDLMQAGMPNAIVDKMLEH